MPRRQDIESVLIIGAGPIVIGQACEFDYFRIPQMRSPPNRFPGLRWRKLLKKNARMHYCPLWAVRLR
jgi:hypothetical protein